MRFTVSVTQLLGIGLNSLGVPEPPPQLIRIGSKLVVGPPIGAGSDTGDFVGLFTGG
jgi:hypothetical protein